MTSPADRPKHDDERAAILAELLEVYTPEGAAIWLRSPNPMLNGAVPEELIAAGDVTSVRQVIAMLVDGAFV